MPGKEILTHAYGSIFDPAEPFGPAFDLRYFWQKGSWQASRPKMGRD